ncbi:MAG: zinc-binding dehydrogenase [Chloroflexota bacterium]
MPQTARAVVTHGQSFDVREYPIPDPAPGTVLLKQELSGICGTDLHNWQNGIEGEVNMGHEPVGIIAALGQGVTKDYLGNPVKEGDRIVLHPRNGGKAYGFRDPRVDPHFGGGFADYLYLADPNSCFVKTTAPADVMVLAEPFAIGVHSAMRANVQIGDTVIVQGSGAIGLLTLVCAKISGAARIILVGGPKERLEIGKRLGANVTIDIADYPDPEERIQHVLDQTPRREGAEVVFECAGFLPAIPEGLKYVKQDGTFVEVGHFVDVGSIELNPNKLFMVRNLRMEAIWGSRYPHFVRGLPILENNEFPFSDLVSHVLPLEKISEGFDALNGTYSLDGETVVKIAVGSQV